MKDIFKNKYDRIAFLCLTELLLLVAAGAVLAGLIGRDGLHFQKKTMKDTLEAIRLEEENRYTEVEKAREAFDKIYSSRAEYAAFHARKDKDFVRDDEGMRKLRDQLECTNIFLLDQDGNLLAKSGDTDIDFTKTRYNELRSVFTEDDSSKPFQVTWKDGKSLRYYGAKIDDGAEMVVEEDPAVLEDLCHSIEDREAALSPYLAEEGSFCFVISDMDDTILYDSRGSKVSDTASEGGIDRSLLKDGKVTSRLITDMLAGTVYLRDQKEYVVVCVPKKSSDPTLPLLIGALLAVMGLCLSMILLSRGRKKGTLIALAGTVFMVILSFYLAQLHGISMDHYKKQLVGEINKNTEQETERYQQEINDCFQQRYMTHAKVAAKLLGNNPDIRNRWNLRALSKALGVDYILIYDKDMKLKETNADLMNLNLSKDEDDPFYELSKLRFGLSEIIWGPKDDPITGEYHEYLGVSMKNHDTPEGFILVSVKPDAWTQAVDEENKAAIIEYEKYSSSDRRERSITLSWLFAGMTLFAGVILLVLKGPSSEEYDIKPSSFMKGYLKAVCAIVSLMVFLPEHFLKENSILTEILSGQWKRGLNIRAFTACLIALAVFAFAITVIGWIARLLAKLTEGQTSQIILACGTVLRGLGVLLWLGTSLYFLGVPVKIMVLILAILLLIIGFGGNTIIGDIVSGFYIYLAGLFHVGDRIGIDGHGGTVKYIWLTHTVLEDGDTRISVGNRKLTGNLFTITRNKA